MEFGGPLQTDTLISSATGQAQEDRLRRVSGAQEQLPETREGLEKVAKEFESVFMNTLLKAMRKTVPDNKLFNSQGTTKFYQQMHDAELSKALASGHSSMGIADLVVQQFSRNLDQKAGITDPAVPAGNAVPVGPPAPSAVQRYRAMSSVGNQAAKRARLQFNASQQGQAVADTLNSFQQGFNRAAQETGLDPALLLAVVMEESGGQPNAVSHKGAQGLMQLMPETAQEVGVVDSHDPEQNLLGGARYLAKMINRYDGRLDVALAAYNAGPGNVDKAGGQIPNFPETRQYVERVGARYQDLSGGTKLANEKP